jgi:hypothetical protein
MICLSPDEVERRFDILGITNRFTDQEKQALSTTSLGEDAGRIFVFPAPAASMGLNILNLREIVGTNPIKQPSFFDHPWYLEEPFGRHNCEPGWHAMHMDVLPESISKPINYSSSLELPTAIEVVLMLFLHYIGTGEHLLLKKHTWTKDEASMGRHVTVGAFGRNGVFISGHPGDYSSRGLGICRKLPVGAVYDRSQP